MNDEEMAGRWSCQDLTARAYDYLDGELSPDETAAARRHLAGCPDCRGQIERERRFLSTIRMKVRSTSAPERLEDTIRRFLNSQ